jgi:hypothetical protein
VTARYDTGDPFLVERLYGKGKVLALTTSFNTEWGDFPVNDIFLPFVYQLVKYSRSTADTASSFNVGEQVAFYGAPGDQWDVRTPDGKIIRVILDETGTGWFRGTDIPGNYQAVRGAVQRYFSVNVDTRESNLTARDEAEFQAIISGGGNINRAQSKGIAVVQLTDDEKIQNLWRIILLFIVALFMAETYLANRKMGMNFGEIKDKHIT